MDRRLGLAEARAFCEKRLVEERRLAVHHPAKTWWLGIAAQGVWICNHTPRLLPLHTGLDTLRVDQRIPALEEMLSIYLKGATNGARLDEGLSNFGLAAAGQVYYLDDDIYQWDDLVGLAAGMGVWLRQLDWLTPAQAQRLGSSLRRALSESFPGTDGVSLMQRQLWDMVCVNDAQIHRHAGLMSGLRGESGAIVESGEPRLVSATRPREQGLTAILADVHGNLPALEAVLAELHQRGVSEGVVLGDVVGYGPHPAACIRALRERGFRVIKGNHDNALAQGIPELGFSKLARWALEWSKSQVSDEDRQWLDGLPLYHEDPLFLGVHGAPQDRSYFNAYVYRMTYEDNLDYMAEHDIQVCFHGHTHVQGYYFRRGEDQGFSTDSPLDLGSVAHCLVCPGSVGQPRSRRVGCEFALLDRASREVSFHLIDYDVEKTVADMAREGFPETLMSRLLAGE